MTHDQHEVYRRIMSFAFDVPDAQLPFCLRLAREQGWTVAFAGRVIDEYKKFTFLAVAAGHPVCPSEDVDVAWHLHLTYTRAYWQQFCPEVLGKPLHHQPTQGGPAELAKHMAMYEQTLASYHRLFEAEPPRDVWPNAAGRFHASRVQRVDLQRNWVVPKPRWAHWATAGLGGVMPAAAVLHNPFDFDGPSFLWFYVILLAVALVTARLMRRSLRDSARDELHPPELSPLETAYLAGGKRTAVTAAIAALVQRRALQARQDERKILGIPLAKGDYRIVACGELPPETAPLERTLHGAAGTQGETLPKLHEAATPQADLLATRLEQSGLLLTRDDARRATWWPALIVFAVLVIGLIKLGVGISRDKPVGFLIAACIATTVAVTLFLRRPLRTSSGDRLMAALKERHASLNRLAGVEPTGLDPSQLALATALFGTAVLVGGPLDDLHRAIRARQANGGGGCGSACGGGGGGGCGGGGCGGGCGGCS